MNRLNTSKNFVIAAGGTGGHLFPGLAVGEVLLARGHKVMVLISEKEIDRLATIGRSEFRIEAVAGIGMPSPLSPTMFKFLLEFARGLKQCKRLYRNFSPDAVLGMGGFTSLAPILAGRARRVPTFVHESNAIPGKANRLNARFVDHVLLGFESCRAYFGKTSCLFTGTPVRASLKAPVAKESALAAFGLLPGTRTVLFMGGSQGAGGINLAARAAIPILKARGVQIIHLTGKTEEAAFRELYSREGVRAWVGAFCHQMQDAYSLADLTVARSGAASLTEISTFGLPSILVPYPQAADDHQTLNARIFEGAGAARRIANQDVEAMLPGVLGELLDAPDTLNSMAQKALALAPADAAERVATLLEEATSR
jgi:UDP-N-acetylglucosamine--N-acetylmuramyl-(pentapeptide) pyrophosphoryl-undecaprenol N-acetylglucosamine transferase